MPTVNESRDLISAGVNYNAGDWASVGAEASVDMLAVADLNRGVDIGLGVEALARLDGAIRQYIAADVNGQAHAAARVRAQVQMPLDLFDEAGLAVRLQAVAEAAVGVQLGIGLSIGGFLALAGNDPRLRGVPIELLKIFLDEFTIQGGVMAKAAASAMAYANLVATGSFIKRGNRLPGFTIAAEAGVGLKAGAGFRVFARFGVDDPRRLVRRTIDVAVDGTLAAISDQVSVGNRTLLAEAAAPLKIGLRCAFELGAALAENGGAFAAGDRGKLALRLAQVGLEELQRLTLERGIAFASQQLKLALRDLPFDNPGWTAAQAQRQALVARLMALPGEPFEATDANRTYWRDLVTDAVNVAVALAGSGPMPASVVEPLSVVWCGAQLLMKAVERISVAQARASVIGASPLGTTAAFNGSLPVAPVAVRTHVNAALGRSSAAELRQQDAVAFVLRTVGSQIEEIAPDAALVVQMLTGRRGTPPSDALALVFANLGAFAPGADGTVDAEATLAVLRDGLRTYVSERIDGELVPLVADATSSAPELRIYLDEVLIGTLRTVVDTVFDTVLAWQAGNGSTHRALRELCSSLVMRLFGRSLVVTGDVLLAHALGRIQQELRQLATSANSAGGIVPTLAGLTGLNRDTLADLVSETLEVCAETFGPMPAERRARMRDLMYQMIDTTPPAADATTLESLKSAGMVGNAEAAFELAQLLGEEIAGNLVRFVQALLTRIAATLLVLLTEVFADIQHAVEVWMQQMEGLARDLLGHLADLLHEIDVLQRHLDDATDAWLAQASALLGGFAEHSGSRSTLRGKIMDAVKDQALDAIANLPGYGALPTEVRRGIRRTVRGLVDDVLDEAIFDPVIDVLLAVSAETVDLLDDLRAIEPGDDLAVAIADIALDRIEDALRDAFDGDPSVRIKFDAPMLGEVDLGRVRVRMGTFISVVRGAIRALGRFDDAVAGAAGALEALLTAEADLRTKEDEHKAASAIKDETDQRVAEIRNGGLDLFIAEPQPGSAVTGPVTIRLRIPGGTGAMLSNEGLSHRRVFVWVNEQELTLESAEIGVELPLGGRGLPTLTVAPPEGPAASIGGKNPGHPSTRARLERHDAQRRERLSIRLTPRWSRTSVPTARTSGTGIAHRFAGVTLPPPVTRGIFPPRVAPPPGLASGLAGERSVLVVTIPVPGSMLHEGINAVACTLVPGMATRRVERAVSFLYVPSAPAQPGRPIMPPIRVRPDLPAALATVLAGRGVTSPRPASRAAPPRQVRGNTWVTPKAEREKTLATSRARIKEELATVEKRHQEAREAVKAGVLRPRSLAAPSVKHRKKEPRGDLL